MEAAVDAPSPLDPGKLLESETIRHVLSRGGDLSDFITNQCTAPSKPPITGENSEWILDGWLISEQCFMLCLWYCSRRYL